MKSLTLFDLVFRSMRRNIKHYYLYFFALIFTISLYFIFLSLQADGAVGEGVAASNSMIAGFKVANILLIAIALIFIAYSNAIFFNRRSKEVGIYQLIGLTKGTVARMLVVENFLLGLGALFVGVGIGTLASRFFLLLYLKVIGVELSVALHFSWDALVQTFIVFMVILAIISLQMVRRVYRTTLIDLFNANRQSDVEAPKNNAISVIVGILGIALIGFGYWLSGRMLNEMLLFNMIAVLFSTIFGSFLVFRVSIGALLNTIRRSKKGHLSLTDSLSLAPLVHRMKSNANSLTLITTLSAMTLTMVAIAYSTYYSAEETTRNMMPQDFGLHGAFISVEDREQFKQALAQEGIAYSEVNYHAYRIDASILTPQFPEMMAGDYQLVVYSEDEVAKGRYQGVLEGPTLHYPSMAWLMKDVKFPTTIELADGKKFTVNRLGKGSIYNLSSNEAALVVDASTYEDLKAYQIEGYDEERYALNITDEANQEKAVELFESTVRLENHTPVAYYKMFQSTLEGSGMFIFISGFLGLVFLMSTGSILYFKQMTEAEQEKASYRTLRQLGFSEKEIMRGIRKKQWIVFGFPLLIGLLHSWFAVKSADVIFMTDVTIPTVIAMVVYSLIYMVFAILTLGYYRRIVHQSL